MSSALIGYTGFVGGTLKRQSEFTDIYNSQNIGDIVGKSYDLVVCAGAPAAKWVANQQPVEDLKNLELLMSLIDKVTARRFVLISTVDVYRNPVDVDESTPIDPEATDPYGRHRFYLEEFVRRTFEDYLVLRLPGLFGIGLKKNFVYDLLHHNALDYTHKDSEFQWYDMSRLWMDVCTALGLGLKLVNFATEPVRCGDVAAACFGVDYETVTERGPIRYDMHTLYASDFGGSGDYLYSADETIRRIRDFVIEAKNSEVQ